MNTTWRPAVLVGAIVLSFVWSFVQEPMQKPHNSLPLPGAQAAVQTIPVQN